MKKPRILVFDIETAPIIAHVWGLWENNVALNQIVKDWHVLSWCAKWYGSPVNEIMYQDQRKQKEVSDDKIILKAIWKLLDQADIVITQNGKKFDRKKLNARFILNGMQPPSSYRHIDTKEIASKHFAFTSAKLEYMTDKLCKKYKKLKHTKFPGHELWTQCLAGNKEAWKEMERYNKHDVLSLEELASKLIPWDNTINFNVYNDDIISTCGCKKVNYIKWGFRFTNQGKYQRFRCSTCGAETRGSVNLLSIDKRKRMKRV